FRHRQRLKLATCGEAEAIERIDQAFNEGYAGVFANKPYLALRFHHDGRPGVRMLPALVDTGAAKSVIHSAFIDEMNAELIKETSADGFGGTRVHGWWGRAPVWLGTLATPVLANFMFVDMELPHPILGWRGMLQQIGRLAVCTSGRSWTGLWPADHSLDLHPK
ncbi:MAG: retropepsin-like aspartic protease, partial [Myxococcota bacterium]